MTFSADTALLIFGGVALFGFMFFILAMSEVDTDGKRSITGSDLAWLLFSVLIGYAFSTAIIFGNAVFIHWGITHWYGRGILGVEVMDGYWWTVLGIEVVAAALLILAYRFTYWVFEMTSKTLDWTFRMLARVAASTARFCISSLTWWCGLFAPRKETPENTDSSQNEQV